MSYELIKKNFEKGLWTKQQVKVAFDKKVITKEQYTEITGEAPSAKQLQGGAGLDQPAPHCA